MTRDQERRARASQTPIVGGLPDAFGIGAAMELTAAIGHHLRGLADALLVDDFPGSTLRRADRELLATAVSAGNDCFFCMDSHGAFAAELLRRDGAAQTEPLVDSIKGKSLAALPPKLAALAAIALQVRAAPLRLTRDQVEDAKTAGASDGDVQLAVLIASAFCMYNRLVDGLRAKTMADPHMFAMRAPQIAERGYLGGIDQEA